jgi:hypothetical protein
MNTDTKIAAVLIFLGCLIGIAITICVYATLRRRRLFAPVLPPSGTPQE